MSEIAHTPVLVEEIMQAFNPHGTTTLLDATLGHGGHTAAYLKRGGEGTKVVGIEADEQALARAKENLQEFGTRVTYIHSNYFEVVKDSTVGGGILQNVSPTYTHILLDLGIGSHQFADEKRGFSFSSQGALTMRYGQAENLPPSQVPAIEALTKRLGQYPDAQDIVEQLGAHELRTVIWHYGEEKFAGRIAEGIVASRAAGIQSAEQLADIITRAVPKGYEHGRIHPATRTFQALRLAVNRELEVLEASLPAFIGRLETGGRIAVISFHSLEDRIVKNIFRQEAKGCICPPEIPTCVCGRKPRIELVTKKPMVATPAEVHANPRSRSAKVRIAQRILDSG